VTSQSRSGRRWVVAAALAVAVALVSLAAASARPDQPRTTTAAAQADDTSMDAQTLVHAEVACDLTGKARQATGASQVRERVRYAAAVLLLDQAITESARAARADTRLAALDAALQAAHAAGHEGDHDRWRRALRSADAECRAVLG
jgi:hypothetical protein